MKKLIGFNIKRNKKLLVSDIIKFYELRGYDLVDADARGMVLKRGSLWGNMSSMHPEKWLTKVELEIVKKERMDYNVYANYHFVTSGFFRSRSEDKYYEEELQAFSKAIENFEDDSQIIESLAQSTNQSNFRLMVLSVLFGSLLSILFVFAGNSILNQHLPIAIAFIFTLCSILVFYWFLSRMNKKI